MNNTNTTLSQNYTVAIWLLICCALVFAMVILGGVTRLTGSGLSMTDWRPLMGWLPPFSDAQWQHVFTLYQQTPEFLKINSHMDVFAFKNIFWLEYLHRLLGRIVGIVFLVPFILFLVKGYIKPAEWPKYSLMFILGGLQGALGWYMVKSGLINNPYVSQYRLSAHLSGAFLVYAYMFWVAMSLLFPASSEQRHPWYRKSIALTVLTSVTIVSGGFVAGLKAGKIYNTFPLMGDHWIPPGTLALEPLWRNFFENMTTVQLDHRVLAILTFTVIIGFWIKARKVDLPRRSRPAINALLHTAILQVVLGVSALLMSVPILLGSLHQVVAMILFTILLYIMHSLRRV